MSPTAVSAVDMDGDGRQDADEGALGQDVGEVVEAPCQLEPADEHQPL